MSETIDMPAREPGFAEPPPAPEGPRRSAGAARLAVALAAALLIVLAGIATSPFWARSVAQVLPWGRPAAGRDTAVAGRLATLAREITAMRSDLARLLAAQQAQARRLDEAGKTVASVKKGLVQFGSQLAGIAAHPPVNAAGLAEIQKELAAQRTAEAAGLAKLQQVLTTLPPGNSGALTKLQQQVTGLDARIGDIGKAVAALAARPAAPAAAPQQTRAALLLSLMQLRQAVDSGETFAAQYRAFVALAAGHKRLLKEAQPLAPLAPDGVPSRAALARQFRPIAAKLAMAPAPPAAGGWSAGLLGQLRGLVRVRRLGASAQNPAEAALATARAALARGNVAEAVAAIEKLPAADQGPARPWLRAAHRRLAAEAALAAAEERLSLPAKEPTGTGPGVPAQPSPPPAPPGTHS